MEVRRNDRPQARRLQLGEQQNSSRGWQKVLEAPWEGHRTERRRVRGSRLHLGVKFRSDYRFAFLVMTETGALWTADPSFPNEDAVEMGENDINV